MGSISMPPNTIPVLNFSMKDLAPESSSWCSLRTEVRLALEEYGCFEAVLGDVQLHGEMLHAMEQFFDLPLETRLRHPGSGNDRFSGRPNLGNPLWGTICITEALDPGTLENLTNLMWPEGNSRFCETIESYATQGAKMEQMVRKMIFESYSLEHCHDSLAEATTYWIRLNRYKAPEANETKLGLRKHTDTSFLTVLTQSDVDGLEIQARNGEWITVTPSPSSCIVIVGDPLMAWSNGRLHSPPHHVMMKVDKMRYSVAVFAYIKGTIIQTPQELVDDEHPLLFKPFDHFEYRRFVTSEGQKVESAIKAYAGVCRKSLRCLV